MADIYMAGGMRSNWQDKVISAYPQHTYFDPRNHGLKDPKDYTEWDLSHVVKSDLIFAFMEKDNPSGFGMALEIGFAYACGIDIILVDEKEPKYFEMLYECSNYVTNSFEDGLDYLGSLYY